MRRFSVHAFVLLAACLAAGAYLATSGAYAEEPSSPVPSSPTPNSPTGVPESPAAAASGTDVMTRGPIHEAFAEPVTSGGVSPLVVPKKPPEPIDEVPPDAKPADETAVWIGGYWAWDDERKDFEWVSGVWRVPPPGQRWVTGYWTAVSGGYSWVPGFWAADDQEAVSYYPEPPASLEEGPSSEPPSADDVWVSGCWQWTNSRYAWQPGYWTAAQPNWLWVPASYYWSPRGWVFSNGYWDYRLDRRGMLFAPVYFSTAIYRRPGFVYTPSVVIDAALATFSFFVRPDYAHYYFGDYCAAQYDRLGIYPWFDVRKYPGYRYDPLLTYYGWRNRTTDPNWLKNIQGWHAYYRAHPNQRLPHDLASARRLAAAEGTRADRRYLNMAGTLDDWRRGPGASTALAMLTAEQRGRFRENQRLMRQFGTERARMEAGGMARATAIRAPVTLQLPAVARTLAQRTPRRFEGSVREAMKPIVPPNPTRRPGETPREARRPAATGQSPEAAAEERRLREERARQREPEKAKRATEEKRAEERREPEKPRGTEEKRAEERREPEKPRGTEEKRTGERREPEKPRGTEEKKRAP